MDIAILVLLVLVLYLLIITRIDLMELNRVLEIFTDNQIRLSGKLDIMKNKSSAIFQQTIRIIHRQDKKEDKG